MRYCLDRFEEDKAVLECTDENGSISAIAVPRSSISAEAREGDVLISVNGFYYPDKKETEKLRKSIAERLARLSGDTI